MKILITIYLVLILSACGIQPMQPDISQENKPEQDSMPLEATADEAYHRSDWIAGRDYYEKLIYLFPDRPLYWYRLGNIYTYTNKLDEAIIAYRQAISLAPGDADIWLNLGMAHLKQSAISFNAMEIHTKPDNPNSVKAKKLLTDILYLLEQSK
jgi:cytochrome c-type biogenesis protein CcmH/NrfG